MWNLQSFGKRLLLGFVLVLLACLLIVATPAAATAQCGGFTTISLSRGREHESGSGSGTSCYQLTGFSSEATSLSLRLTVYSGSVNIFWADGAVQVLSRKLNPRAVNTYVNYSLPQINVGAYTLAVVPAGQSDFTMDIATHEPARPTNTAAESGCPTENGMKLCKSQQPLTDANPILDYPAESSVLLPFQALCRSRVEINLTWTGGATDLQVILETANANLFTFHGGSSLTVYHDIQPDDLSPYPDWQWEVINSYGGSVDNLQVQLGYPDDQNCKTDPYKIYGVEACIYGYVWREAFTNDRVCVTGDVRSQAAYDNSQASQRVDPNGAYGPDTCISGYVWREASPSDHVCVTPDVRSQVADDNNRRDWRRDTLDNPLLSMDPNILVPNPPVQIVPTIPLSVARNPPVSIVPTTPHRIDLNPVSIVPTRVNPPVQIVPTTVPLTTCPGLLPSRMVVGQYGIVLPGKPNNLRADPTTSATRIGMMNANDEFLVVAGPVCADGYAWWQVNYGGQVGWTAESGGGNYWIGPI